MLKPLAFMLLIATLVSVLTLSPMALRGAAEDNDPQQQGEPVKTPPPKAPDTKQIQKWIDDLDNASFQVRENGLNELIRAGEGIVPALEAALRKSPSPEAGRRLQSILARYRVPSYDADFNGWHWVYGGIVHAQTFQATGSKIKSLKLRVAQLSGNRPAGKLTVEVRDSKLENIFLQGTIDPAILQRNFRWQSVDWKHVSPIEANKTYALVFHSQGSVNTGPWAINAIYQDMYPLGRHWYTATEDFFFDLEYHDGKAVRVGPRGEQAAFPVPINSGATGSAEPNQWHLQLQSFGPLPAGKLNEAKRKQK